VTTVAGNASVVHTTENSLRVLDHVRRSVPVYRGAPGALIPSTAVADQSSRSRRIHGDYLVLMGGSHQLANVTPSAEFNIWADPEGGAHRPSQRHQ